MSIFSNSISTLRNLRIERSDGFVSSLVDLKDTFCSILTLLFSARILFGLGFHSMLLTTISDCFFLRCWKRFNFLATAFQGKSHGVSMAPKIVSWSCRCCQREHGDQDLSIFPGG